MVLRFGSGRREEGISSLPAEYSQVKHGNELSIPAFRRKTWEKAGDPGSNPGRSTISSWSCRGLNFRLHPKGTHARRMEKNALVFPAFTVPEDFFLHVLLAAFAFGFGVDNVVIEGAESPRKGLLDVLMMLETGEESFTELKTLDLSPNTVLSRLREAQKKGFVDQKLFPRKGRKPRIKYVLTEEGEKVLKMYESIRERYTVLRAGLQNLQEEARKKEKEMKYILSSNTESAS